ncbi:acyltransferase family protein [Parafrankia sp. FMc2]|uniref:acyltransferase family protein n=1 Tax=Parafrankia sp. FMc2 TaxID=3233196 RepID=UPI0034D76D31
MPASRRASAAEATAAAKFAYNPALDGLRVVCIYIILAGHMGAIHASNVAVDMFCVLSGFLITTLLVAEQARTGTVSIGRFLVRRAFRLMPGMWFYLLVGLAVTVVFKWDDIAYRNEYIKSALSAFFNVNNWYKVAHPEGGGRWLAHVWSLSMEEQFYLVWPFAFVLFARSARLRPYLLVFLIASIGIVLGWTYVLAANGAPRTRIYLAADTHIAPLLIGALVAVWRDNRLRALAGPASRDDAAAGKPGTGGQRAAADRSGGDRSRGASSAATRAAVGRWTTGRRLGALGLPAAIVMLLLCFLGPSKEAHDPNWIDYTAYVPTAVLGAILIIGADVNRDATWVRLLGHPKMAWLGKMTYTIYLWHYPFISAAAGQLVPRIGLWPAVFVAAVATTITAYVVNSFVEKPIQARRPKWSDTPRGPARPAADEAARPPVSLGDGDRPGRDDRMDRRDRTDRGDRTDHGDRTDRGRPAGERGGRDLVDLPELSDLPELADLPDPREPLDPRGVPGPREPRQPEPVGTQSWAEADVDWVDEGYPLRDRDPRQVPPQADRRDRVGAPGATDFGGPRPGSVTYDRPDGPPVYEHGPAVGSGRPGGWSEPTPVPDWAAYPALRGGPDTRVGVGVTPAPADPRAAGATVVGETMNLRLPAIADPGAEAGRRPSPPPGHEPGRHGQHGHYGEEPVYGHAGRTPAPADRDHAAGPPTGDRGARAGRPAAEPDPLFGPMPGAGEGW